MPTDMSRIHPLIRDNSSLDDHTYPPLPDWVLPVKSLNKTTEPDLFNVAAGGANDESKRDNFSFSDRLLHLGLISVQSGICSTTLTLSDSCVHRPDQILRIFCRSIRKNH